MNDPLELEVDANFEAFRANLPSIIGQHRGEYALLRHREIEGYFSNVREAMQAGLTRFSDRLFSVQEVTDRPVDLGFFSHAVDLRIA